MEGGPPLNPLASALSAAVLWGTIGIAYKLGTMAGACGDALIVTRVAFAALAALAFIITGRAPLTRWSLLIGGAVLGPLYAVYLLAVEQVGAGLASILLYTAPLWVVLLATALTGEAPGKKELLALPLGLLGIIMVTGPNSVAGAGLSAKGLVLGLASGLAYALYLLLARLAQLRGATSSEVGIASLPPAVLGTLLVARPQCGLGWEGLPYALYLAFFATLLPYFLNARALSRMESSRVSIVSLVEPLTAVILGYALLGERLTALQALGGLLILSSVALVGAGPRGRAPRG